MPEFFRNQLTESRWGQRKAWPSQHIFWWWDKATPKGLVLCPWVIYLSFLNDLLFFVRNVMYCVTQLI